MRGTRRFGNISRKMVLDVTLHTNVMEESASSIFMVEDCHDGAGRFFQNVGKHLPDYTVSHPRS
jgi:hypothetical protein